MWGNRLGWVISAAIVALFGYLLVDGALPASMDKPTGELQLGESAPTPPVAVSATGFKPGTNSDDAGPLYRQAMEDFDQNSDQYQKWEDDVVEADKANPVGVQKLVEARACGRMDLFAKTPDELINYKNDTPRITAIQTVGQVCDQIALLAAKNNDKAKAQTYAEAEFALGYNLAAERVRFVEWETGMEMMISAAQVLTEAGMDDASKYGVFAAQNDDYMKNTIAPFWTKLDGIDPVAIQRYPGDFFHMAQADNPERMWRIEAILRLGRLRWQAGERGDQLVATHYLTLLAADPSADPLIHAAAVAARDLTVEQFRIIG